MHQSIRGGAGFAGPAEFRILVRGHLGERWADRVGDLEISIGEDQDGAPQTELTGSLPDQAALMGVLQHLYARGVEIVSVERVKGGKEPNP